MKELILNIYLIINDNIITELRGLSYEFEGSDEEKINLLKKRAGEDFPASFHFQPPKDKKGNLMTAKKFLKLKKYNLETSLFEEIFERFNVSENPLICVTPVIDGKIIME